MPEVGKTILITGGSTGIGKATVFEAAKRGYRISFTYYDETQQEPAEKIVSQVKDVYGVEAMALFCDQCFFDLVGDVVKKTTDAFGTIDVLVNNAGATWDGVSWKMSEEKWDRVIAVNLKGCFNFVRHVAPILKEKQSGKIVNISSINGLKGKFGTCNYSAAKAGIIGFTKTLAKELGPFDINVNAVAPGTIRTPLINDAPNSQKIIDIALREVVLKRLGEPEDVAKVILFLASEDSRHILGEVIKVDGGQYI
jgi:3-oxoacyl-[acyl-carrier protein] reductase